MGEVSKLVALDLDGPNAASLLYEKVGELPLTLCNKTGKGVHCIYRHPGVHVKNSVRLLSDGKGSGVDVRGDGGYIVAPPSVHGDGTVYEWVGDLDHIAPLPQVLLNLINGVGGRLLAKQNPDPDWVDRAMLGVGQGERNDTAARLIGYWLQKTESEKAAWQIIYNWNRMNRPPIPDFELNRTFSSIASSEAKKHKTKEDILFTGAQWADELQNTRPREGIQIEVPGFKALGGLVKGDLIVIAGRPGMGKSSLSCMVSNKAIDLKIPTLVVTAEMTKHQWGTWMLCSRFGFTMEEIPAPPLPDAMVAPWRESPVSVIEKGSVSIDEIVARANAIPDLRLVIVDHVGKVKAKRNDLRYLEIGETVRALKALANDKHCTVIVLSQLNRNLEYEKRRPRLSDLRECGDLEQEADSVAFLWVPTGVTQVDIMPMCMSLEKNRHGAQADIEIVFDKPRKRFQWSTDTGLTPPAKIEGDEGQGNQDGTAEALPGDVSVRDDDGFLRARVDETSCGLRQGVLFPPGVGEAPVS